MGARDGSGPAEADGRIGQTELRMIEAVEELRAELQLASFAELDLLGDREIKVIER